jgi:DNA-binding GntR family transcriptional regulator
VSTAAWPAATTASTASRRIAAELRDRILAGQLAPGARIVQDDLAAELRTSRLPVREALHILESAGLVTLRSNAGAWVARMDRRDCEVSYAMRERLEPLLLAESLPALTDRDIGDVVELHERILATSDVEEFLRLDRLFHWATYRGNQVQQLELMISRLWDTTQHYRRAFSQLLFTERRWIINAEHSLLTEAVRSRDTASAESVLALHIHRTAGELAEHPELFAAPPGGA